MNITGQNIIAGCLKNSSNTNRFSAYSPRQASSISPSFEEADSEQINEALQAATEAFSVYKTLDAEVVASFLEEIGEQILLLGDALLERANEETALPKDRLLGERGRTINQLKMFAGVVREGSWVEAIIDRALPQRTPLPRPDLRRMLQPMGPVVVFGASNFPLAFSVAGGDTASALAARCPVIVKAHPAHPGTSELVAQAISKAAQQKNIPAGVFSMLQGQRYEVGLSLVNHPLTKAVAFTGSLRGGRALFDAASRRKHPIPVFAEMGSINPVFLLPDALKNRFDSIAEGLFRSFTMGVGQFCTNPGLVVTIEGQECENVKTYLSKKVEKEPAASMLTQSIAHSFREGLKEVSSLAVKVTTAEATPDEAKSEATAALIEVSAEVFLKTAKLSEELFGPSTVIVSCKNKEEVLAVAHGLEGHLTASLHATEQDLQSFSGLVSVLTDRVGRLLFDGFPTGVEVCYAMHHGGPYPSTTSQFTSVGATAIKRFARPICYQNAPQSLLPPELQNNNPRNIWRLVEQQFSREAL